jgi:hypothetical protein
VFVGPVGQSAADIQILGSSARTYGRFAAYNKGTFLTEPAAAPLDVACVFLALLMTGMGSIWALIALCAMIEKAWQREFTAPIEFTNNRIYSIRFEFVRIRIVFSDSH